MILGCGYVGRPMAQYWRSQELTVTGTTTTPDRLAELADCCDRALCLRGDDEAGLRSCQHAELEASVWPCYPLMQGARAF